MFNKIKDLTSPPDLQQHAEGTGSVRNQRPVYKDFLPPCNSACPAGENIQGWLALAQAGKFHEAWQLLMQDNPMPAIIGRVCYHPCETACNRSHFDATISVHAVERFLGDKALEEGWKIQAISKPTGKKILIIGAGPAGLSAAYHLRKLGHKVEIREAGPVAGGMMHFGIPAYRLPRPVLQAEVQRLMDMDVKIKLNHKVEDLVAEKQSGGFDAVFVAIGAHISKKTQIPAREAGKILDAVSFLEQVSKGNPPKIGRRVAVYGGGNTAMDAARTAKRLGIDDAMIIYRRDRDHMPAHDFEADEALEEGVKINWLRTIKEFSGDQMIVEVMRLENGKPVPTGQFETLQADSLILALGQDADSGFLQKVNGIKFSKDGTIQVDQNLMTGAEGIFSGGDMVPGERSVTIAVGHGKKAAKYIDSYLKGGQQKKFTKQPVIDHTKLHLWYKTDAPQKAQAQLPVAERIRNFSEVMAGFSMEEAVFEAKRCLSCGNCFECDGCYGSCPEQAIIKLGPGKRYQFNYDQCTGCQTCYEQCPVHAIDMVPESEIAMKVQ